MQHIPLLHVLDPFDNLAEKPCSLALIQSHHLCAILSKLYIVIVVSFHRLKRFDLHLQLIALYVFKDDVNRFFILKVMIELGDKRALHLTLNPNLIESCMRGLLLGKGFFVQHFHRINVVSYSALHLVNEGACTFAQGLTSDDLIVAQR